MTARHLRNHKEFRVINRHWQELSNSLNKYLLQALFSVYRGTLVSRAVPDPCTCGTYIYAEWNKINIMNKLIEGWCA